MPCCASACANKYELSIFYTHSESEAIERLYRAADEGLRAVPIPYVEVHMTNIEKRGLHSILAETGVGIIAGFSVQSYLLGLDAMLRQLRIQGGRRGASSRKRRRSSSGR